MGFRPHSIVDDAEDDRDEEVVLDACVFPHRIVSPEASLLRRRIERDVREGSCDKRNVVFAESDAIHVLYAIFSFKTVRLRVVRAGLRDVCDCCERLESAVKGLLISDSGQSRFKHPAEMNCSCLMTASTGVWKYNECDKVDSCERIAAFTRNAWTSKKTN